jgi:hypothetical protein
MSVRISECFFSSVPIAYVLLCMTYYHLLTVTYCYPQIIQIPSASKAPSQTSSDGLVPCSPSVPSCGDRILQDNTDLVLPSRRKPPTSRTSQCQPGIKNCSGYLKQSLPFFHYSPTTRYTLGRSPGSRRLPCTHGAYQQFPICHFNPEIDTLYIGERGENFLSIIQPLRQLLDTMPRLENLRSLAVFHHSHYDSLGIRNLPGLPVWNTLRDDPRAFFPRLERLAVVISDGLAPVSGSRRVGGIIQLTDPDCQNSTTSPRDIKEVLEYYEDFDGNNPNARNPE